jgi:hypothetical protein
LQVDDDYLPIVREEFRRWTQEQLDWIFKGIPFGATSPLPEDKKQPVRESKENAYRSRGKYEAYVLEKKLGRG